MTGRRMENFRIENMEFCHFIYTPLWLSAPFDYAQGMLCG